MSQKRNKHGFSDARSSKCDGFKKTSKNSEDLKFKENIIKKLYETFHDSFDLALMASVAHTCQWDIHRATEALMILGGKKGPKKNKSKSDRKDGSKNKAKSLPGTLKPDKSSGGKGMGPANPVHCSTNSLSSGQVWQRHYKSKPQSPGLLTMIPPHGKEVVKLKKGNGDKATPKSKQSPELKKASVIVKRIQQLVQNGVKVLILMRGVPGSGKTHLAQVVVSLVTGNELSQHIFSTDDYFVMMGRGHYAYDFNQVPIAHNWNQKRVSEALKRGINPVVVDNTHTQAWEMQPYVMMAVEHGYLIEVLEPVTEWRNKEAELTKRNIHSVPREKIRQMLDRYEPGWTGEKLLKLFGLKYKHSGSSFSSEERRPPTNSLLAQHRQHSVIEAPEKPKRKRNGSKKKDRRELAGIEISEDKERHLEELNKLFAEYGKTMDAVSKQKVLESGVPISEVVSRMRKLQGNVLPLPKTNIPSTIQETDQERLTYDSNAINPVPNYSQPRKASFSESVEPDMSSSNASETSECETDTDMELPKWKNFKQYFDYGCPGYFVDGEDLLEDDGDDEGESRAKSDEAIGGKSKFQITSSQEELSLIDYGASITPGFCSQEDLSLLNYDTNLSPKTRDSSSSSEEQETQMLSLQESLREVLIDSSRKNFDSSENHSNEEDKTVENSKPLEVELSDSLLDVIGKRFENKVHLPEVKMETEATQGCISINQSLLEALFKKFNSEENKQVPEIRSIQDSTNFDPKKSPDLEEVPLPSIPLESNNAKSPVDEVFRWCVPKRDTFKDIVNSWEHPVEPEVKDDSSPKPERPKNTLLGVIKKTGIQRDKSPEELLKSADLSWSSISFNSSWEDVTKRPLENELQHVPKPQRKFVQKSDSSTNTAHTDFDLWKNDDVVKLDTQNRNINENYKEPPDSCNHVSEILMLDKSSMTVEAEEMYDDAIDKLSGMFPSIPREHLNDIVEKCKGNILWAVELLLDSSQNFENLPECLVEENPPSYNEAQAMNESAFESLQNIMISDGKKTIKRKKDRKSSSSEVSILLKKQIEDSIHINEELYQDKTLFLKKLRHGEIDFGEGPIEPSPDLSNESLEALIKDQETLERESEEEEEEETIPMKMDPEFFKILQKQFGYSEEVENECFQASFVPIINIPLSLGQQIYYCWLENVNKELEQMQTAYDKMVKEDELLAAALQEEELEHRPPDLREIMDMELAMLMYKQDQAHLHGTNQETMAAKLSKQLLFEAYPNMDKKMLLELFQSEGNSFKRTIEVLSAQENQTPMTVVAPECLIAHENKLIEQVRLENLKKSVDFPKKPIVIVKEKPSKKEASATKDVLLVNPAEFRQRMAVLHQQRIECCRLAQEAFRKKSYSVASYFSRLASLYKERLRELNKQPFPSTIFEEQSGNVTTKLDLHFLFVSEAIQILDIFLDHHIENLKQKSTNDVVTLFLITGRGQHSTKGISKIKPAVKKRLQQRNLGFQEKNPGMLIVKVHKNDLLSKQM